MAARREEGHDKMLWKGGIFWNCSVFWKSSSKGMLQGKEECQWAYGIKVCGMERRMLLWAKGHACNVVLLCNGSVMYVGL